MKHLSLPGFDRLVAACQRNGLTVALRAAPTALPDTAETLNAALDPELARLLGQTGGGQVWNLFLFGDDLLNHNLGARQLSEEPAYDQLVLYAQVGHQAAYLACVPALAGDDGRQPVVYADFNEAPVIKPIASTVDRGFVLLEAYLGRLAALVGGGDVNETIVDLPFPRAVPELIAADDSLVDGIASGHFNGLCGDPDAIGFLADVLQARF